MLQSTIKYCLSLTLMLGFSLAINSWACTILVNPLYVEEYNPLDKKTTVAKGRIKVKCRSNNRNDKDNRYRISLSAGQSNNVRDRFMTNGHARLYYNLYKNASCKTLWGGQFQEDKSFLDYHRSTTNRNRKNRDRQSKKSTETNAQHNVFLCLYSGQKVPAGTYHDELLVTVHY